MPCSKNFFFFHFLNAPCYLVHKQGYMLVREASEPVYCMDAHMNNKQILIAITVGCMERKAIGSGIM